jgi:hypothetical protein
LDAGAQTEVRDSVSELGSEKCDEWLADSLCLQDGMLPIHYACKCGEAKLVSLLFKAGADLFYKDEPVTETSSRGSALTIS